MTVSRSQLHGEVENIVGGLFLQLAHDVVSCNSPDADELMKAVIIDAVAKLDVILALETAIAAAFGDLDLTDDGPF